MANDITKLYQFLGTLGDWKSKMDKNNDGTIIKSEFRNFMNDDFEWDGTPSDSEKNSVIDQFWAKFDTNKSNTKIGSTRYRNKNALDNNEIDTMQQKIGIYENLNAYTSKLTAPSGVDSSAWKASVTESLAALTETFIQKGGKADDLNAYLDEQIVKIKARTTADQMAVTIGKQFKSSLSGYDIYSDSTFKGFIDAYIQTYVNGAASDNEVPSDNDIQSMIKQIAQAYIATSNGGDTSLLEDAPFNYSQDETSSLNDLQKNILKQKLQTQMADIKNESDYQANKDAYDTAINSYMEEVMAGLTFADFKTIQSGGNVDGFSADGFKSSQAYKNIKNTIAITNMLNNITEESDLYKSLADKWGDDFAKRVMNDGKYISAMKAIVTTVNEKMLNGDFNTNGEFDMDKAVEYAAEQIASKMSDFYANGFGDMSIEQLNKVYEGLAKAADAETDADKQLEKKRNAAVQYCDALASKGTRYKSAVEDVFGSGYKTAINKMLPTEISEKIAKLQDSLSEIVDISSAVLTEASWGKLTDNLSVAVGKTKTFTLTPAFTNKDGNPMVVTSDHITYKSSNSAVASVDTSGTVTVNGVKGTYQTVISILVDGTEVGKKTITVKSSETGINFTTLEDKPKSRIVDVNDNDLATSNKTLKELYNTNSVISLLGTSYLKGSDWKSAVASAKTGLASFVDDIKSACSADKNYDSAALEIAATKVKNLYNTAFDNALNNWAGKKSNRTNSFQSEDGETYSYRVAKFYKNSTTKDTVYSKECKASDNQLGLRIGEQYDDNWFQIVVNSKCVMDLFAKYYAQALGA